MPRHTTRCDRMARIRELLERVHGRRQWQRWGTGVSLLVQTILSQNTSDANSSAGFRRLWRTFKSWNKVADAPAEAVEKCIRIAGLSRIKAPRIQAILRRIRQDRGRIDLEFLRDWEPARAMEYLLRFDGVGPKTANCVLLFSFGMPVFPVDTHIHRIAVRMGLVPRRTSAERAHDLLRPMIAPGDRYALHVLLIVHGRTTCKAARPLCDRCALRRLCAHGRRQPGDAARFALARPVATIRADAERP